MDTLASAPQTQTTTKAGLAAGTTTTYTIANQIQYSIRGKAYAKAAVTNAASPTLDADTGNAFLPVAANQGSIFVFCLDLNGNVSVVQGDIQTLDVTGLFINLPQMPSIQSNLVPFAYLIFKGGVALAAPWVFGTSNLSGVTGATYSFTDVQSLPDRLQLA